MWRQEQLEIVCTKILNLLPANLWRNPWLHQEWPSKGLNFAATTKTGQKKTGRKWCLLTNPPSYSLLPTNPSFADHMDLHQRTHGTSNQPLSIPHRSWCGGAFPAKAEVVFIFSQKDKQWMPHGILASEMIIYMYWILWAFMDAQLSKKTRHHATKPNQSWIGFTP